jgi:ferric-dicitrate binding protein FerR (iron transport regulator)
MILQLNRNDFLRLRAARGVAIEVLNGRVWITEDGRAADTFLGPGRRYRIGGQGLVLVGTEVFAGDGEGAEIALRAA